jgi:hypothetical protein
MRSRSVIVHTDDSFFLGVLNRLNSSNYDRLFTEAVSAPYLSQGGNWDRFVDLTLEKCQTQACFVDVFVRLLVDLVRRAPDPESSMHRIHSFIRAFLYGLDDVLSSYSSSSPSASTSASSIPPSDSPSEYDAYCISVKNRSVILGTNKAVLRIGYAFHLHDVHVTYVERMTDAVRRIDDLDGERFCLILELILEAWSLADMREVDDVRNRRSSTSVLSGKRGLSRCVDAASAKVEDVMKRFPTSSVCGNKCRFRLMDVIEASKNTLKKCALPPIRYDVGKTEQQRQQRGRL